jgi:hypothetical protein
MGLYGLIYQKQKPYIFWAHIECCPYRVGMNKNMIDKKELHINNDEQQKFVYIWINEYPIHDINYNSIMITMRTMRLYHHSPGRIGMIYIIAAMLRGTLWMQYH